MAQQKRQPEELTRTELIAALEESRFELSDDLLDVRDSLSVGRRVRSNFRRHKSLWLGGGAVLGFLLARPLLRNLSSDPHRDNDHRDERPSRLDGALASLTSFAGKHASKVIVPLVQTKLTAYLQRFVTDRSDETTQKNEDSDKQT